MDYLKTPYLQLPEIDGITVMWETDVVSTSMLLVWEAMCPEIGGVQYWPQGEPQICCGESGTMHRVKASGLQSGKDYCYQTVSRAEDSELISERYVFRTKAPENGNISFTITSEIGGAPASMPTVRKLVDAMSAERPDFAVFIGDVVRDGRIKS